MPGNDLQFQEYAGYVTKVLGDKGFKLVNDIKDADMAIFLGYTISNPQEHNISYSAPIWGQTGYSSATTYGNAFSSTTSLTPSYGIIGAVPQQRTLVTFTRYILIEAYDAREYLQNKRQTQLWKTEIVSTGQGGDLRELFPVLIAAAKPYIAENTGQKIQIQLDKDDKKVLEVKGLSITKN